MARNKPTNRYLGGTAIEPRPVSGDMTGIQKRVPTGYVVIDRDNVDTPEAQAAIYKSQ